jgi:hypothetical protein
MKMKASSLMVNVVVLVFLSPQQTLAFSSNSGIQPTVEATAPAIQRTVEVATPWFQVTAAGFTIAKHGTELLEKKRKKAGNSDDD